MSVFKTDQILRLEVTEDNIHSPSFLAPEMFKGESFDEKCDVYSFGITMWEIMMRSEVYADVKARYSNDRQLLEAVAHPTHPLRPSLTIPDMAQLPRSLSALMTECWHPNPKQRPSFSETNSHSGILSDLTDILDSVVILGSSAREFWEDNFGKKQKVLWSKFVLAFSQQLGFRGGFPAHFSAVLQYLLTKGEDEVSMSNFGELLDHFGPLNKRYGDKYFYDTLSGVAKKLWFFGRMGPVEAAARLLEAPAGTFLVRFSSGVRGNFTITTKRMSKIVVNSVAWSGSGDPVQTNEGAIDTDIIHLKVDHEPFTTKFSIFDRSYSSLDLLIEKEQEILGLIVPCPGSIFSLLMSGQSCNNLAQSDNWMQASPPQLGKRVNSK